MKHNIKNISFPYGYILSKKIQKEKENKLQIIIIAKNNDKFVILINTELWTINFQSLLDCILVATILIDDINKKKKIHTTFLLLKILPYFAKNLTLII